MGRGAGDNIMGDVIYSPILTSPTDHISRKTREKECLENFNFFTKKFNFLPLTKISFYLGVFKIIIESSPIAHSNGKIIY